MQIYIDELLTDIFLFINYVIAEVQLILLSFVFSLIISFPFMFLMKRSAKKGINERNKNYIILAIITLFLYACIKVVIRML